MTGLFFWSSHFICFVSAFHGIKSVYTYASIYTHIYTILYEGSRKSFVPNGAPLINCALFDAGITVGMPKNKTPAKQSTPHIQTHLEHVQFRKHTGAELLVGREQREQRRNATLARHHRLHYQDTCIYTAFHTVRNGKTVKFSSSEINPCSGLHCSHVMPSVGATTARPAAKRPGSFDQSHRPADAGEKPDAVL
jgi:hypothetical protein